MAHFVLSMAMFKCRFTCDNLSCYLYVTVAPEINIREFIESYLSVQLPHIKPEAVKVIKPVLYVEFSPFSNHSVVTVQNPDGSVFEFWDYRPLHVRTDYRVMFPNQEIVYIKEMSFV